MADLPQENLVATETMPSQFKFGIDRQPSIHLIKIPEKGARMRALQVLIALQEGWVSMEGDHFGLSTRQVAGLEAEGIPFERASK